MYMYHIYIVFMTRLDSVAIYKVKGHNILMDL